jgi:hypothetical protein
MKKYEIIPFQTQQSEIWDQNLSEAANFCFMGTRKFLSYHQNRFVDQSLAVFDEGNWIAALPAAIDLKDSKRIVSHPGATFGGLYFHKDLRGKEHEVVLKACLSHYRELGFSEVLIKPVPTFYRAEPIEDDYYGIYKNGGQIEFCRPTCTIPLHEWGSLTLTKGRKSSSNKATAAGVKVVRGFDNLDLFWVTLENNLRNLHQASPVHSLVEMKELLIRFPNSMELFVALKDSQVLAGALCFIHKKVFHTQYMSNTTQGRDVSALDNIIHVAINYAREKNLAYFDFGTSQGQDSSIDDALYFYKQSFGAGSFCQWAFNFKL